MSDGNGMTVCEFSKNFFAGRGARFKNAENEDLAFELELGGEWRVCHFGYDGLYRIRLSVQIGKTLSEESFTDLLEVLQSVCLSGEVGDYAGNFYWSMETNLTREEDSAEELLGQLMEYAGKDLPKLDMLYALVRAGRAREAPCSFMGHTTGSA